ncbi:hypothetical protein LG3211_4531 [Lysobacter gummosus]|nr:hypothetical protein LG3211_4531 [Lysobacter gummosus]
MSRLACVVLWQAAFAGSTFVEGPVVVGEASAPMLSDQIAVMLDAWRL